MSTKFDITTLNEKFYDISGHNFVFITSNHYSPFQLAKALKIKNIIFMDNLFHSKLLGYGLRAKKKVFCDKSIVNSENKDELAKFAKSHYNPIECSEKDCIIVKSSGDGDIYDIQYSHIPVNSKVFYSNMKEISFHGNHSLVGFSADKSILNGSKSAIKQIRIASFVNNHKKNIFPTYEQSDLMAMMRTKGAMDFKKLKFLVSSMDSVKDNMLFKPLLSNLGPALGMIKTFTYALDSFTNKELLVKVAMTESRIKRVSNGSKVSAEVIQKLCALLGKLREGDLMSMVKQASAINPQFKQFESLFGDLLKKK
jgi:hypothetical protein